MPIVRLDSFEPFQAVNLLLDPGAIGGPVVVPQAAQIVINWGQEDAVFAHTVLYGRYAGPFGGTVAQANNIMTALTTGGTWTAFAAFLASTSFISGVTIRDVNTAGNVAISSTNAGVPGTSASPALPNEVAAVVTFRTSRAGPGHRGRMYIPGFATNALGAGNVIAAAAVTAVQNWANVIPSAFIASGYTHVLGLPARASYTGATGTVHPARAATTEDVTQRLVRDNHWDTQRRRGLR